MRTVFVTGATGAIGSVLAKYFLEEGDTQVRLLIRSHSNSHLEERLDELRRFWGVDPLKGGAARLQAIAGDVTLPNLGMDAATYSRLSSEVTHVVHSAGDVRLNRPIESARKSAVEATRQIVSFARACAGIGTLDKLEFVSTVGVAGDTAGSVAERAFDHQRAFRNSYEAAKAEAETLVLSEIAGGLPATIHRPSMVVGDSKDGTIIRFQVFYHLCEFLSGSRTAGVIPDTGEIRLDIVPVDYVARAIQRSSMCRDAVGRIFHLCAGPADAPKISTLARRVHDFFSVHGRRLRSLRSIPSSLTRALLPIVTRLAPTRARRSLDTLPFFLAYLDTPQTFANARTQEFFGPLGLKVPQVDQYLDAVLSYYVSRVTEESNL